MFLDQAENGALFVVIAALGVCGVAIAINAAMGTTYFTDFPGAGAKAEARRDERGLVAVQPAAEPAPSGKGKILVWHDTGMCSALPMARTRGIARTPRLRRLLDRPVLSPDGKRVAFIGFGNPPADDDGNIVNRHVLVRALDGKDPGFKIEINAASNIGLGPGRPETARGRISWRQKTPRTVASAPGWSIMASKEKTALDLPRSAHAFGMTPDGKSFVAAVYDLDARKINLRHRQPGREKHRQPDGGSDRKPRPPAVAGRRIDPVSGLRPSGETQEGYAPIATIVRMRPENETTAAIDGNAGQWTDHGLQLVARWESRSLTHGRQVHPGVPLAENTEPNMDDPKLNTETESHLVIAAVDGKNARDLVIREVKPGHGNHYRASGLAVTQLRQRKFAARLSTILPQPSRVRSTHSGSVPSWESVIRTRWGAA